ncbi:hypothetical protein PY254_09205 [Rhodanobacter sp. AS-Z3]|uniref:hypothetical protein n=1 Tax=Rhodanobacter sp. AS-Z3 TaxID=3031330 RepID=UPI00247A4898|nr:hypothetical protein [Rhodanobacter sp. AS-Z3]WEN13451.1 hypothetical protein PY254_09205 [Rhodanobacter sp. AS-Z3]
MKYEVNPLEGVGLLLFGMDVLQVRVRMDAAFHSFKRTPDAAFPCDHFSDAGVFANYDKSGRLEAVEMASPAAPMFERCNLLGLGFDQIVTLLKCRDSAIELDPDGATSSALGISLYAPYAAGNPEMPPESVLVFAAGYYN